MFIRLVLMSIVLAHPAQTIKQLTNQLINQPTNQLINQPTMYSIDDICLHNTSINLGTRTVMLNITTDFSDYTTCDVNLHLMDKSMKVKVEVLPRGSRIEECGWLRFEDYPQHTYDGCMVSDWYSNQFKLFESTTIRLDGRQWLGSGTGHHWFSYTLAIHGWYHMCDLETDECHNTKDDCEVDDCFDGLCNFYCNSCDGKLTCCNSYGELGENKDIHLCSTSWYSFCIHPDMTCDNYTNCEDGSDEVCGVTEASVTVSGGAVVAASGRAMVAVMGLMVRVALSMM